MLRPMLLFALAAVTASAAAQSSVTWTIDQEILRSDASRFWTSPTAIEVGLGSYVYDYEITAIEADARFFTTTITVDVTD